jgi:GNAT superfamily N-acetyltransferase
MKMKLVRGGSEVLGLFSRKTGLISIFIDAIVREAKAWGCNYQDLKKMVILHETAHSLYQTNGVEFKSAHEEELMADQYALKQFFMREHRLPIVPIRWWVTQEV